MWFHDSASLGNDTELKRKYKQYENCRNDFRAKLSVCLPALYKACSKSSVRAIKTVRATMDSAEEFLKSYPNFRLIHLIRGPRGTVYSRKQKWWTKGVYEGKNVAKQGRSYCQTIAHDLEVRRSLEKKYPHRILGLLYEEFLADPVRTVKNVYKFWICHFSMRPSGCWYKEQIQVKVMRGWMVSVTGRQQT